MGRVIRSWSELNAELNPKRRGKTVVFTNGCFDLLHVGHIRYLQEARSLGDFLVLALNSDASVQRLKGATRPIQPEDARAEILAALSCVDYVTMFDENTAENVVASIKPDILVKGGDYEPDKILEAPVVRAYGGQVRALQFAPGYSTTSIVKKIREIPDSAL